MIGFFVISTHLGGAEKSLLELLIELKDHKKLFRVFVTKNEGPLLDELKKENIYYEVVPLPQWFLKVSRSKAIYTLFMAPFLVGYSFLYLKKISSVIHRHDLKVVHSTGLKFHLLLSLVSPLHKKTKFILHIRDIIHSSFLKNFFEKRDRQENISLIANSRQTQASLGNVQSEVVYNGFKIPALTHSQLKKNLGIPESDLLVGIVGVIARWKGQREFIDMAVQVLAQFPNCHFVIVGSEIYDTRGEEGELIHLKKKVAESGFAKKIHFLDFQSDIHPVYQGLDILVHASIRPEPFGRVIVEAMSNSVAVTASDQGGPTEIIEAGISGLLHRQAEVSSMAKNVKKLLENSDLRSKIGTQARLRASEFSMEKHAERMLSLFEIK